MTAAMPRIRPLRLNHFNLVLKDFAASVEHFQTLFGAELLLDLPRPEWRACLVTMGDVIFELFCPPDFFLNTRSGPHCLGMEYQADMDEVRQAVAARGIRIARDIGSALHTDPADCFGVAFEFYAGYFHDNEWALLGGRMKPAAYWRDEHPLGLTGRTGCRLAVSDADAASGFLQDFLSAELAYEEARPAIAARALGLQVADAIIDVVAPTGDGPLRQRLERFGQGVQAVTFGVRDLDQARGYFKERGVRLQAGSTPDSFGISTEDNHGVIFEFWA